MSSSEASWRKQSADWRAAIRQAHDDAELRQVGGREVGTPGWNLESLLWHLWIDLGGIRSVKKSLQPEGVIGRYRQFDIYLGDLHRFPSYLIWEGGEGFFSCKAFRGQKTEWGDLNDSEWRQQVGLASFKRILFSLSCLNVKNLADESCVLITWTISISPVWWWHWPLLSCWCWSQQAEADRRQSNHHLSQFQS